MKVLIVGSRSIETFDLSGYVPTETELIISGGGGGVNAIAEDYADRHRLSKLVLRPDYDHFGSVAPLQRNDAMVALADHVIVVWDGVSKGTKDIIDRSKERNKPLTVIVPEKE
jgi:hypothetical protein